MSAAAGRPLAAHGRLLRATAGPDTGSALTVDAPPPARRAAVREQPLPPSGPYVPVFAVVGAHGGAGATTLARWWYHSADCGQAWPGSPVTAQHVVVVARECMPGLAAAADRLREWRAGLAPSGVDVVALVLIPPRPGRVPRAVRRYSLLLSSLVGGCVYRIGWHEQLLGCETRELARHLPTSEPPQRRWVRRGLDLREHAPADAARTGAEITRLLTRSLPAQEDWGWPGPQTGQRQPS